MKPACCRCLHHRPDVVVLGQPVVCVVVDTDVAGQVGVPISPQEADQIDAQDDSLMFARPMAGDQRNRPALRRVQRRVIDTEDTRGQRYTGAYLVPQGSAICTTPVQQPRVGIMRRTVRGRSRMAACCFCVAEHVLCCEENVDRVQFVTFRWVHQRIPSSSATNTGDEAMSAPSADTGYSLKYTPSVGNCVTPVLHQMFFFPK